jgi:hypothetical protein
VSNDGDAQLAHCLAARTLADEILDCFVREGRVVETLFADDRPWDSVLGWNHGGLLHLGGMLFSHSRERASLESAAGPPFRKHGISESLCLVDKVSIATPFQLV